LETALGTAAYGQDLGKHERHFNSPEIYRVEFTKEGLAAQCHFPFLYKKVWIESW
jgi:hypothetical protein